MLKIGNRIGSLLLCLAILAGTAACSGGSGSPASVPAAEPAGSGAADKKAVTFPLAEPVEYTYMIAENPNYKLSQDGEVLKYLEEKTNVHIVYQTVPNESYTEKYNTLLASGNVPDISAARQAYRYGPQGLFLNITDYLDYAPNFKKILEDPKYYPYLVCADGGVYHMPSITAKKNGQAQYTINYRGDILEELGLKEPEDEDGWYELFKAVKAKYPDMIPLSFPKDDWRFASAFPGYYISDTMTYDEGAKKWIYSPVTENYKAAISFAHKLYSEKLLDPEFISMTKNDLDQKIYSGKAFAGVTNIWAGMSGDMTKKIQEAGLKNAAIAESAPWGTPFGDRIVTSSQPVYPYNDVHTVSFSAKIKNPEIAVAFMDYASYSQEGSLMLEYGIEGKHWTMTDHGPDYTTSEQISMRINKESVTTNLGISDRWPRFMAAETWFSDPLKNWKAESVKLDKYVAISEAVGEKMAPFLDKRIIPPITLYFDEAQVERVGELETILKTIFYEYRVKFITGKLDLSEWDKMTAALKDNGYEELTAIYNDAQAKANATLGK